MLEAAELVIAKYGIDGATLPRIAASARITPTSVYRRFRDKDALIKAVFQRLSERTSVEIENQFVPEKARSIGLVQFSRNVIAGMVAGYRTNAALNRAAIEYCERNWETTFARRARAAEAQGFQRMVDCFLVWRSEIKHAEPESAIWFALLVIVFALRELILFDRMHVFADMISMADDSLTEKLTMVFLRYLGCGAPRNEDGSRTQERA